MRALWKLVKVLFAVFAVILVVGVGGFFGVRAYQQRSNAAAFAIDTPNGINESRYITIGGIQHWVQIRGKDRNNPVLLCVHGGPGGTWIPVTRLFLPWEKDFTVVQWDQRGAGKTLKATGPGIASTMSIERMTQDGIEVAEFLRTHLKQDKVILLGHSWGSILGVNMVKRRPDLFHAFVGTGQVSDLPASLSKEYTQILERARAGNDVVTVRKLTEIGPPPFTNLNQVAVFFDRVGIYQPASDNAAMDELKRSLLSPVPDYTLADEMNRFKGFSSVPTWTLYQEMLGTKLTALGPEFGVPVFFFHGSDDPVTHASFMSEYFAGIKAPHKEMVLLEGGGHFAVWSMADRFEKERSSRMGNPRISSP
jgi:pimeloyl-ACP methyl ester carboxylesterase